MLDFVEVCHYNTDLANVNTDGDLCSDGKEIASINGDTVVNSIDLQQVALSFGPLPGPPYLLDMDVNKDGTVNSLDLSFVAQRFGPCP